MSTGLLEQAEKKTLKDRIEVEQGLKRESHEEPDRRMLGVLELVEVS